MLWTMLYQIIIQVYVVSWFIAIFLLYMILNFQYVNRIFKNKHAYGTYMDQVVYDLSNYKGHSNMNRIFYMWTQEVEWVRSVSYTHLT